MTDKALHDEIRDQALEFKRRYKFPRNGQGEDYGVIRAHAGLYFIYAKEDHATAAAVYGPAPQRVNDSSEGVHEFHFIDLVPKEGSFQSFFVGRKHTGIGMNFSLPLARCIFLFKQN